MMKSATPGTVSNHSSHLPICDELRPALEAKGQTWVLELARWYEADWVIALEGGPEPSAHSVMELLDPARQAEIQTVFESIDTCYSTKRRTQNTVDLHPTLASEVPRAHRTDPLSDSGHEPTLQESVASIGELTSLDLRANSNTQIAAGGETVDLVSAHHAPKNSSGFEATLVSEAAPDVVLSKRASLRSELAPPKPIPGYQIKGILGRGGMGVVYLAQQDKIDRPVALKMILSGGHADQGMLDRFQAEAKAIGRFQHENIVRIYDMGSHEGSPYFSLEFVDGKSLSDYLNGKPIEPADAARLMEPIARAMKYAHDAGVIHRDLKPANVLLTREGVPKVTDFGLAKEFESDQQLSVAGSIVGTPAFMAPEQARGADNVGPLSDVYGLGAMLYCMLTGRPPFQGAKATDTLIQVIRNEPVEPIKLQPNIPKDLETICLKCLQKDPAARYADAGALAEDIARFSRGEPINARPISRTERIWRWCKRNPTIATASAIAASLGLIVMIGGPISAAVIWSQKKEVIAAKDLAEVNAKEAKLNEETAKAAKLVADKNADAASLQEKNAIDALKSMVFVVQGKMAGQANLLPLRQELLKTVENGLARMEKNENSAAERNMIRAGIHSRLGDINMQLGVPAKAHAEFAKCLAVFEELEKTGELPYAQKNKSKIHQMLGDAARQEGRYTEAHQAHRQSLEIRRQWVAEKVDDAEAIDALATSLGKLGSLAQVRGDLPAAEQFMKEALTVRDGQYRQHTNDGLARAELQGAKLVLAKIEFQQGETESGIALMSEANADMHEFSKLAPDSESMQVNVSMFDNELGVLQLYVNDLASAKENFVRSVSTLEKLSSDNPNDLNIHEKLENATYGLAITLEKLGQSEEASKWARRDLELRRQSLAFEPKNLSSRLRLLPALARAGELTEGVALAEQIANSLEMNSANHYGLACGYALLAAARRQLKEGGEDLSLPSSQDLAASAITQLKAAIAGGFLRPSDLRMDPDLEAVREAPEFQALLSDSLAKRS